MRWVLLLAGGLLVIAGIGVAVLRLSSERTCPSGADAPEPVLVARQLIPEATPGSVIVSRRLYAAAVVRCSERKPGALADPEQLLDKVTVVDLFPGQQLTEVDLQSQ